MGALVATGYTVLAVNPMSVARYRERHSTSGAKSDPGDAKVLADLARTDRHNHRPVAGDSDLAEAVKVLARAHQGLIWGRQRQLNHNTRLADACQQWAFCALTVSPGARAFYDQRRQHGDTHQRALRALANRLVGLLHGCLRHHTPYDEHTA